jgi:transcriptional regulator with XRE-family HTH domain
MPKQVSKSKFAELLVRFRNRAGLSQQQLAERDLGLSASYIAMLESGKRGVSGRGAILPRQTIWFLINKLKLWPPDCDAFLEAAGHTSDRTQAEELQIQENFEFDEIWIFARVILDPEQSWYKVVANNILKRKISYCYFTDDQERFEALRRKLDKDAGRNRNVLMDRLECILLPGELFFTNIAVYNPGRQNMYCCGTKPEFGKGARFFTLHASEANRIYETLRKWRLSVKNERRIFLQDARRVFPNDRQSLFGSAESRNKHDHSGSPHGHQ